MVAEISLTASQLIKINKINLPFLHTLYFGESVREEGKGGAKIVVETGSFQAKTTNLPARP